MRSRWSGPERSRRQPDRGVALLIGNLEGEAEEALFALGGQNEHAGPTGPGDDLEGSDVFRFLGEPIRISVDINQDSSLETEVGEIDPAELIGFAWPFPLEPAGLVRGDDPKPGSVGRCHCEPLFHCLVSTGGHCRHGVLAERITGQHRPIHEERATSEVDVGFDARLSRRCDRHRLIVVEAPEVPEPWETDDEGVADADCGPSLEDDPGLVLVEIETDIAPRCQRVAQLRPYCGGADSGAKGARLQRGGGGGRPDGRHRRTALGGGGGGEGGCRLDGGRSRGGRLRYPGVISTGGKEQCDYERPCDRLTFDAASYHQFPDR